MESANRHKSFDFDYAEINARYQFVIFDVQRMANPFVHPHHSLTHTSYLEPILSNAKVLMTYQPLSSYTGQVAATLEYVERQQRIYPSADFLGAFVIEKSGVKKSRKINFIKAVKELKILIGTKLFVSQIEHHPELSGSVKELEKKMFSRKTNIFDNYSRLTDEILEKLGVDREA